MAYGYPDLFEYLQQQWAASNQTVAFDSLTAAQLREFYRSHFSAVRVSAIEYPGGTAVLLLANGSRVALTPEDEAVGGPIRGLPGVQPGVGLGGMQSHKSVAVGVQSDYGRGNVNTAGAVPVFGQH